MKLYYRVTDNSYCISLDTLKQVFLVQEETDYYSPDSKENGAEFEIISASFDCIVEYIGETYTYKFVIVKSTKTGTCYRVLYNKINVYKKLVKKKYLFR